MYAAAHRGKTGIRFAAALVLSLIATAGCNPDPIARPAPRPSPSRSWNATDGVRVLFIGNSHVFTHDLPSVVQNLAASHPDALSIRAHSVAVPNAKLVEHVSNPQTLAAIKAGDYDWVILQEKSGVAFGDPSRKDFDDSVDKLNAEIRMANPKAQVALYMVHAPEGASAAFPTIRTYYTEAAKRIDAKVIPVAHAYEKVRKSHPKFRIANPSPDTHYTQHGCYLTACTIIAALFDRSPDVTGRSVGGLELTDEEAVILQKAAWEAVEESRPALPKPGTAPTSRPTGSRPFPSRPGVSRPMASVPR